MYLCNSLVQQRRERIHTDCVWQNFLKESDQGRISLGHATAFHYDVTQ